MNCPFCQYIGPHQPAGVRFVCGRCGESFANDLTTAVQPTLKQSVDGHRQMRHQRGMMSVRSTFFICGILTVLGFSGGLIYRWTHAKRLASEIEQLSHPDPYEPLGIPALRYVPAQIDGLLAIQTQHLRNIPGLTQQMEDLFQQWKIPVDWGQGLPRALQTDWANILEIVIAVRVEERLIPPQIFIVLHTRETIDEDALVRESQGRWFDRDKRELIRFQGPSGLAMIGWKPVEKYFIIALAEADFDLMPLNPMPDAGHLPERLRKRIVSFCNEESLAWLAADVTRLPASSEQLIKNFSPNAAAWIVKTDMVVAALSHDGEAKMRICITGKNVDIARAWRESLLKLFPDQQAGVQIGGGGPECFLKFKIDGQSTRLIRDRLGK